MSGIRSARNQRRAERPGSLQRRGRRRTGIALIALLVAGLTFANTAPGTALAAVVPPTPPVPAESPAPEPPAPEAPAPAPAPEQPAPEPPPTEAPLPAEPEATEPPATDPPATAEEPAPLVDDPGIVTPLAAVSDCVGGNTVCGTLNIVNVVQGGSATPADWALRANIVGSEDWYDFTSGQSRRVAKPGSYTLEAIGTPGVTDNYTTTLSCFLNDTSGTTRLQFTEAEALVQFIGTGNSSLVASCTFTHTYTAPGTLVLSKGGERTGAQSVAPLAGATFAVYSGGTATQPDTSPANLVGTCVTEENGLCEVTVPSGAQYWVIETAAPAGYRIIDSFDVGTSTTVTQQPYRLRTDVIPAGERVSYPAQTGGNTNLQARGSQWANAAINPTLAQTCGLRVGLLVDLSNSLQSSQQDLRNAAAGFVDVLEGTPSSIGIWTFAGGAPAAGSANTTLPLTPVSTAAGAATVRAKANSLTVVNTGGWEQGTNWDQGLWQVAGASTADTLDVLLVLTDGSPTYYGPPGTGSGGAPSGPGNRTRFVEMENAVASANALKIERGTTVVGVGIGPASAGEEQNLQAISGPTIGQDYFLVDGYEDLQAFLEERALGECAGTVNVTKLVIPAEGEIADAVPSPGWTFDAATDTEGVTLDPVSAVTNETGAVSFAANDIPAGGTADVTVTETQQPGFELVQQDGVNAACTDTAGTAVPVTDAGEFGFTTTAQQGDIVTCTVYNRAPEPTVSLRVDKAWVIDGVPYEDGTQPVGNADLTLDGEPRTFGTTYPQYTVGDTVAIGEEVSDLPSGCTYESTGAGAHVITPDDPNVVTVTNTVTCVTSLTLVKSIANGDATVGDFTLTASPIGGTGVEGPSGVSGTTAPVTPGVRYLLTETGPATYVQTVEEGVTLIDGATGSWDCVVDGVGDYDGADGGVTVSLGQEVTCTATNQTATIVLLKQVINDEGGTLTEDAWDLTADPGGAVPGLTPTTVTGAPSATADNTFAVRPGQSYTLSEAGGGPGYRQFALEQLVAGAWVIVDPTVTVPALGTNTYRFVNVDVAPTLTLVKTVTTDDGGTAAETDWTLSATSPGEPEVTGVTGTEAVTAVPVFGGVPYTLAEDGPDGYTWESLTCDNGADVSPASPTLTLEVGQAVTCTFVNDDVPGSLTLLKDVDNTLGGSAEPADWDQRLTAQPATGEAIAFDHAQTQTVPAGSYTLAEVDQIADYAWTALSCDTGGVSLDSPVVTVANGQAVTCTFINASIAPTLTLVKNVDNQGGVGSATPEQWTLNAVAGDSDPLLSGEGTRTGETTAALSGQVAADVDYTLSETFGPSGYTAGDWACVETEGGAAYPLVSAGVVRLSLGVDVTCEIVNTAIRAEGTIDKQVTDGSPVQNADGTWTISYDIVVTNNSDTSTFIYSLADELQYGDGITPTAASWTGPDGTSGTFTLPAGTATLATDAALPTSGDPQARATHTYTVTVTAEIADGTQDGDEWRCDTAPGVPTAGGFLNAATLSATGEDDQTVFGCAEPAFPTLVKTGVDPATQNPDASWNVSYTLTLTNPGAVAVQAELTDTLPAVPDGWILADGAWTIAAEGDTPAPAASTAAPGETADVWTGQLEPAAVFTYTVSGVLTPTNDAADPGECATGGGIVNTAGVTSGEIVVDAEGCVTVQIAGVTVDKGDGAAQQLPDGTWQIDYVVTVANTSDEVATTHTLTDAPALGEGINLISATWVGGAPAPNSPLAAGATAQYTHRVVASIDPAVEEPSLECEPGEGGAFFNTVAIAFPGGTDADDGCAEPGGPTVTKTAEAATPLGAGVWAVSYAVTVSNTSGVTVAYTLEDRPDELTGGITLVTPWAVTGPVIDPAGAGTATLTPDWDGVQQPTVATGLLPDGATHTYTVTGQVSVVGADPDALTCGETSADGGVWNTARVDNGAFEATDEDCSGLVVVPVQLEKSDGTVSELGQGRWRIDYVVTVTNPGLQPTTYTLTDAPDFDTAFTILAQGWVGSPSVADVEIPAGGVDTYTYRVDAASTQSPLPGTALVCTEDGGGFFNTAAATHPGGVAVDSGCAVPVPPAPAPAPGLAGTGGTLPIAATWLGGTTLIGGILLLMMLRRRHHRA
ncbi:MULTISPECIES: SpaA isopeptide-forming pilin-related protein [unclassified Microbacterium]|uniref:SpaA isopeptide-forming pilin-related protein n=1 Tax=unclassified Microbacterium TaxID=2609290 RepID=UPI00254F1AFB|nr:MULTISPECIES: SpaA isopeptide-forming pilin-related protein [unclassified Microbacterium]WIM16447.1 SpaA isopeptide-forming pilin-related protein [Microbacterium sp. zg-B96]